MINKASTTTTTTKNRNESICWNGFFPLSLSHSSLSKMVHHHWWLSSSSSSLMISVIIHLRFEFLSLFLSLSFNPYANSSRKKKVSKQKKNSFIFIIIYQKERKKTEKKREKHYLVVTNKQKNIAFSLYWLSWSKWITHHLYIIAACLCVEIFFFNIYITHTHTQIIVMRRRSFIYKNKSIKITSGRLNLFFIWWLWWWEYCFEMYENTHIEY